MSNYVYFTKEQKARAHATDLVALLQQQGEVLKRSGTEWEWRDGSQRVTIRGNAWFHQYERVGGDAISFVQRFYDKSFPEAVQFLLGESCGSIVTSPLRETKQPKAFQLPPKHKDMHRAYAYLLNKRGLDRRVVDIFVQKKMIYEAADNHNVVFVGYDKYGMPRHAQKRSTSSQSTYKGNVPGSVMEHCFHWHGESGELFLFEAPIDMLSYISMMEEDWQQHNYAAACSVTDKVLFQMMKDDPSIRNVYICFDNDGAGQIAAQKLCEKLAEGKISAQILIPTYKDWNEDLVHLKELTHSTGMQQVR